MFGGLREEVPLDIEIDKENRKINLKFENMENFEKILGITTKIWDNAVDMLIQVTEGNFDVIRDIPDVDE
jgi:preprotein translocase subunit SecA